tara:strand:- start:443 stop:1072 length:630 start_codon:yes stop_codon:yes gene_type:complete
MEDIKLIHGDSLQALKGYADNHFDIAIVDPPYGLGTKTTDGGSKKNSQTKFMKDIRRTNWDNAIPSEQYFTELKRVSKNQIIWGGNYMAEHIGNTKCILIWDKMTYIPTMSQFEFAFCSMNKHPQMIKINSNDPNRQHPTQKPIKLYKWLIDKYTNEGDLILDTHLGSGSIAIACHYMKRKLIGYEIDKEYYDAACKRFKEQTMQQALW